MSVRPAGSNDNIATLSATLRVKQTMAADIHSLLRRHLEIERPVILVGHDIGLMMADAYAQSYRREVSHLVVIDAPLLGRVVFIALGQIREFDTSPSTAPTEPPGLLRGRIGVVNPEVEPPPSFTTFAVSSALFGAPKSMILLGAAKPKVDAVLHVRLEAA